MRVSKSCLSSVALVGMTLDDLYSEIDEVSTLFGVPDKGDQPVANLKDRAATATDAFDDRKQYWPEISWESMLDRDPTVLVPADLDRGREQALHHPERYDDGSIHSQRRRHRMVGRGTAPSPSECRSGES